MALTSGMKLCPLRFQSLLAAGGMGEVYRAHDSRSNRTIAIKVLPASFSADRDWHRVGPSSSCRGCPVAPFPVPPMYLHCLVF
jgi:serine/threonine protein kinase